MIFPIFSSNRNTNSRFRVIFGCQFLAEICRLEKKIGLYGPFSKVLFPKEEGGGALAKLWKDCLFFSALLHVFLFCNKGF